MLLGVKYLDHNDDLWLMRDECREIGRAYGIWEYRDDEIGASHEKRILHEVQDFSSKRVLHSGAQDVP